MLFFIWQKLTRLHSGHPFLKRCSRRLPGRRFRPFLEPCEDRLMPSTYTVVSLGDSGAGSGLEGDLRYAINTANSNDEPSNLIVFQDGLSGTIPLTQGKLVVTKALEIDGPWNTPLAISGNHQSGVLDLEAPAGQTVILWDLTIADGTGSGNRDGRTVGGGLYN
jgi:hypothetical protein